jgi:succinate dehydrogenase/fumarate reductase flavoprotein subunit
LLNNQGERFMKRYAPEKMELATRDLVSQAIETEINEGRGFGEGMLAYVQLDLRHLGREKILDKLPGIRDLAIAFEQVDPIDAPIPIRPTCHYSMGGIDVSDYKTCATVVEGVFAAGECSCVSIHGANRLGGNSLADVIVFGKTAGIGAVECAMKRSYSGQDKLTAAAAPWKEKFQTVTSRSEGRTVSAIRDRLAETMWYKVGIFRKGSEIEEAQKVVDQLLVEYETCKVADSNPIYNTAFVQYIELGNMLTVAKALVLGALHRKESRGCHLREDYPQRDDVNYLQHTLITQEGSEYKLTYRPVVITKYQPAERKY